MSQEFDQTIAVLEQLYSAVVADVLDELGFRNQTLRAGIQSLTPTNKLCGRVFTARAQAVNEIPEEPYKLEFEAIDAMERGDVFVIDAEDNTESAFWGELLSTACIAKGIRGVVMSTCSRDMWRLREMNFPVFGIGCTPADSKGRIDTIEIGEPITIEGVTTKKGDFIVGDPDGVVIIPSEVLVETLRLAQVKVSAENTVRDELAAGVSVTEVFRKHRLL